MLYSYKHFIMTGDLYHCIVRWTHYIVTTLYSDKVATAINFYTVIFWSVSPCSNFSAVRKFQMVGFVDCTKLRKPL